MKTRKSIAIVGGGFFGLRAALYLAKKGHKVSIYERNSNAMQEASLFNQARVHGGYHYPRSLRTAARCRANYSQFIEDFQGAIFDDFESIYAIASDSKVNSIKFFRLMEMIGAPIEKISALRAKDFNTALISGIFKTQEVAFNAKSLLELTLYQLEGFDVDFHYNAEVESIGIIERHGDTRVLLKTKDCSEFFQGVIITTYGLDKIQSNHDFNANYIYEVCELIRVRAPEPFRKEAVTIMDGPYWSLTPWPAFKEHALTHVRYTPHARFSSFPEAQEFLNGKILSRSELFIRDASRYVPAISESEILGSEYTIKTILKKRDSDDSRPIFVQRDSRILSVLGSKIDTIYDVEEIYDNFIEVING